jgi:hypothetical protein
MLNDTRSGVEESKTQASDGEIVLTAYFTSKIDWQRRIQLENNNFQYIRGWYESVHRNGMKGVIFHDRLSNSFSACYETDQVRFIRRSLQTKYSINDERFLHYSDWLKCHRPCKAFLTDLGDITFNGNPFKLINKKGIYIGSETMRNRDNKWMIKKYHRFYGRMLFANDVILNAGIIGGWREDVEGYVDAICAEIRRIDTDANCNMAVVNYVARTGGHRIITGFPLHSKFKKYEGTSTRALIVHK